MQKTRFDPQFSPTDASGVSETFVSAATHTPNTNRPTISPVTTRLVSICSLLANEL